MADLSPAAQAYKDKFEAYQAQKAAEGYKIAPLHVSGSGGMEGAYENWANANVPVEDLFTLGREFRTNAGKLAKTKKNKSAVIYANPNSTYSLENERGQNQTLLSGSGLGTLDEIYAKARELSQTGGTKANWRVIETLPDGSTRVVADDDPKSKLGKIADIALPIAGALLAPLTGGLSGVLGASIGAAGGSALSGIAQGKGIGDILKGAALSGGLSYLGGSALGGLGGGGGGAAASGAGGGAGALGANSLGGALASNAASNILGSTAGAATGGGFTGGGSSGTFGGAGSGALPGEIVVTGARNVGQSLPGAIGSVGGASLAGATNYLNNLSNNDIIVEGQKPLTPDNFTLTPEMLGALGITPEFAATAQGKSTVDKIISGLRAAGLLTGFVGNAIGGGGKSGTGTMSGPLGTLNPIFSKTLPTANVPGGVGNPSNFAPRQMPGQNWNRYAMQPEQSFFNYVPQRYTPPPLPQVIPPQQDDEQPHVPHLLYLAKGGLAVKGRGTGRSDEIDAKLSDGEYVVDAETVALLGDGSSNAGAKALDNLRVAVRKHKGRSLAKGKFSAKAKQPERYLGVRK